MCLPFRDAKLPSREAKLPYWSCLTLLPFLDFVCLKHQCFNASVTRCVRRYILMKRDIGLNTIRFYFTELLKILYLPIIVAAMNCHGDKLSPPLNVSVLDFRRDELCSMSNWNNTIIVTFLTFAFLLVNNRK